MRFSSVWQILLDFLETQHFPQLFPARTHPKKPPLCGIAPKDLAVVMVKAPDIPAAEAGLMGLLMGYGRYNYR